MPVLYGRRRPRGLGRVSGIGSVIVIGGIMVMILAVIGMAVSMGGVVESTYMELAFTTPRFDYAVDGNGERGNQLFEAYAQMRLVAGGILVAVVIYAGLSRVLESSEMALPGLSNRIISRSVFFVLVLVVFPPIWDMLVSAIDNTSLWILNPLYSFDGANPCPNGLDTGRIRAESDPYMHGSPDDVMACRPELKVRYVFGQMLRGTEVEGMRNGSALDMEQASNWMGSLQTGIIKGDYGIFQDIFLGLTKALVSIQVLILSLVVGIMSDMLTGMIMAGLPVFLMLSLLPRVDAVAGRFVDALPALMLLPLMSALIIVVGAGSVADASASPGYGSIYLWVMSTGVVFFAVTLPVLLVPLLGSATHMATGMIGSAASTSVVLTGVTAVGGASRARDAYREGRGTAGAVAAGLAGSAGSLLRGHSRVSVPGIPGIGSIGGGANTRRGAKRRAALDKGRKSGREAASGPARSDIAGNDGRDGGGRRHA